MRYWAATGLLILGGKAAEARAPLAAAMHEEPLAQVRVVAAEAAAGLGETEAVSILAALTGELSRGRSNCRR